MKKINWDGMVLLLCQIIVFMIPAGLMWTAGLMCTILSIANMDFMKLVASIALLVTISVLIAVYTSGVTSDYHEMYDEEG